MNYLFIFLYRLIYFILYILLIWKNNLKKFLLKNFFDIMITNFLKSETRSHNFFANSSSTFLINHIVQYILANSLFVLK